MYCLSVADIKGFKLERGYITWPKKWDSGIWEDELKVHGDCADIWR